MKVAVCISGQPRSVEQGFEPISRFVLNTNRPDVFVHMWWDPEQIGKPFTHYANRIASGPLQENSLTQIINLYKPVAMHYEPQIQFDGQKYNERKAEFITPFYSLSQRYSMMKCHKLRREYEQDRKFVYDAVLRLRFDWKPSIPIIAADYNLDAISAPSQYPHKNGVDDSFAISSSKNMNVYSEMFDYIDEYWLQGVNFCDEVLMMHHLTVNNIGVEKCNIPYDLIRG